ncbi:hypothetical protein D2C76_01215 [Helicobacter pylori]|nr:hypothetical protein D2C76_01215 [Helicobacter pylori]
MKSFSLPLTKPSLKIAFLRDYRLLYSSSFIFLDKLIHKLRLFHKFKLSFFFFDLILGVILISLKRKSDESDTKHR